MHIYIVNTCIKGRLVESYQPTVYIMHVAFEFNHLLELKPHVSIQNNLRHKIDCCLSSRV